MASLPDRNGSTDPLPNGKNHPGTASRPTATMTPPPSPLSSAKSLPMIDISSFLDQSSTLEARQATASSIKTACMDYGFFYLIGHGIPVAKLGQIVSLARAFFALRLEEKNKIKRHDADGPEGGDGARGYQSMGENITLGRRDMHEAVDLYREWDHAEKQEGKGGPGTCKTLQGPNLWPAQPEELKPVYLDYITQLQHVAEALVRAMGVALDLGPSVPGATRSTEDEEVFVRNTDQSFWVMRMIRYPKLDSPALTEDEDITQFSCGEHTDYGCVTLLLTDPTPGALQVLLKDNTTWLNADPIRGAFVVNIGDMIERWTNGLWKSTRHRVIHRGDGYRVSVPFFYEPNFTSLVKPLQRCVERSGKEPIHEGNTYGEHLLGKVFNNFYN
ncbi:Clavaminate synthase-like protein [Trematosphaeria pertusa]|uniref:Clavaminate synthase-like protein n=1 Tax=Trematosphaeria pertusa TaxID=390896 RepID=A0A6A6I0T3_9PLEO|nr:Clavaminate synthase-like protein [Trematosphaeria pertusa]KAF2243759.1 Clavaminate synthase-like protein [Trematosphaeria pertusa]